MFDVARHFLPLSVLKQELEAMALTKMNVVHLHLSDNESIAFAPESRRAAAFSANGYNNGGTFYYSSKDLQELAAYAYGLGIFVQIELSMPGRVAAWANADE